MTDTRRVTCSICSTGQQTCHLEVHGCDEPLHRIPVGLALLALPLMLQSRNTLVVTAIGVITRLGEHIWHHVIGKPLNSRIAATKSFIVTTTRWKKAKSIALVGGCSLIDGIFTRKRIHSGCFMHARLQ